MAKPKAILFDIGGVCVVSPMQAIYDYEVKNGIPKDYINFAISRAAPNGAWHRLERGEIKMDDGFFDWFRRDLNNPERWEEYHLYFKHRRSKSLKELAGAKATQLGDPVSLKAETSPTDPTPDERGAGTGRQQRSFKSLVNRSMLGDPVSLKAEKGDSSPLPDDSGADNSRAPALRNGPTSNSLKDSYSKNMLGDPTSLQNEKLESHISSGGSASQKSPSAQSPSNNSLKESYSKNMLGDPTSVQNETVVSGSSSASKTSLKESYQHNMLGDPTSLKNEGSANDPLPTQQDTGLSKGEEESRPLIPGIPAMPTIDSTAVFWDMMAMSRAADPHMLPALKALRESRLFVVGALSNTVIFPPDHEYSRTTGGDIHSHFDVFVSSAHVGLRKPDPAIYRLAIERLDRCDRGNGGDGIRADQVVFLDDIGSNLKAARDLGIRTIKVHLGKVNEAVTELEQITGLRLADGPKSML